MSPEAQRIAIAEACGWKIVREHFAHLQSPTGRRGHCCGLHLSDKEIWRGHFEPHPEKPLLLPDYLNDLNAMHEALRDLPHLQYRAIEHWILGCCSDYDYQCKSAPQAAAVWAEATLRTIGKWVP